jgi:hypothetical protein
VLSHPDLCVLALTYSLHQREKAKAAAAAAATAKSESGNEARCVHESGAALLTARDSRVCSTPMPMSPWRLLQRGQRPTQHLLMLKVL